MVQPTLVWSYSLATGEHRESIKIKSRAITIEQVNSMSGRLWRVSREEEKEKAFDKLSDAIQFVKEKFQDYIHDTSQIEEFVNYITLQEQGDEEIQKEHPLTIYDPSSDCYIY